MARFDSTNPEQITRLRSEISKSRTTLRPFIDFHTKAVSQYAGNLYGGHDDEPETPLPEIGLLLETLRSELSAQPPQADIRTFDKTFKTNGAKLRLLLNDKLRTDEGFFSAIRRVIDSSFVSLGIMHVGVRDTGTIEVGGEQIHKTEPYAEPVMLEDSFHDMRTSRIEDGEYQGHAYQVDLEEARENPKFDAKLRSKLQEDGKKFRDGAEELESIAGLVESSDSGIYKKTTLLNVWLPEDQLLLIMPNQPLGKDQVLQTIKWEGPSHGPYSYLGYNWIDGNSMPLSIVMEMMPIHLAVNNLARKLIDSAEAFKRVGLVQGSADSQDVKNIMNTPHGGVTGVSGKPIEEQTYGGIDPGSTAVLQMGTEWFSYFAGNLNLAGGLSAQSETLGQEQILAAQVSRKLESMRDAVNRFVQRVISDYAFWLWRSQETFRIVYKIANEEIDASFPPEERSHSFWEHAVQIEPYSMSLRTPQQKFGELMQVVTQLVVPLLPMFQQQGAYLDARELLRLTAQYRDMPELTDLVKFQEPIQGSENAGAPGEARQAANTNRTTTRVSKSANGNPSSQMIQSMLRGGRQ